MTWKVFVAYTHTTHIYCIYIHHTHLLHTHAPHTHLSRVCMYTLMYKCPVRTGSCALAADRYKLSYRHPIKNTLHVSYTTYEYVQNIYAGPRTLAGAMRTNQNAKVCNVCNHAQIQQDARLPEQKSSLGASHHCGHAP
jgi:hypothetical protein